MTTIRPLGNQPPYRSVAKQPTKLFLPLAMALLSLIFLYQPAFAEGVFSKKSQTTSSALFGDSIDQEPEFLSVEEAFQNLTSVQDNQIVIQWRIAPEYYLYHSRFSFNTDDPEVILGEPKFTEAGEYKDDEIFGRVRVFHDTVNITLPILQAPTTFTLNQGYQGCAEAGLCYPPEVITTQIKLPQKVHSQNQTTQASPELTIKPSAKSSVSLPENTANGLAQFIQSSTTLTVVLVFFVIGLGLTFTPCVLPMVPILSSIIAGQNQLSAKRGFVLSTTYVLGMALSYALAGVLVSMTGARIQIYMQHPAVLSLFSVMFVLLALAMFGFFEIKLPSFVTDRLNKVADHQKGGQLSGVFIMGVISALVVSPCVSAPLAGALLAMAQAGDTTKGGLTLLALGLGMGAPLIALGTTGANFLPRAGQWMDQVKYFFGALLIATSIWLIRSVLPPLIMMWLWALFLIISAIYLGALSPTSSNWGLFRKGLGVALLLQACLILVGAAAGQTQPLTPLKFFTQVSGPTQLVNTKLPFSKITTVSELDSALLSAKNKQLPVMIDYYADWCISCIEMEHGAFSDPRVHQALSGFTLLQVDLTNNPQTNDLLDKFNLIGPPSILFFTKKGELMSKSSIAGMMNTEEFLEHLNQQVSPNLN